MTSNNAERRQRIKEQSREVANYLSTTPPPELVEKWANHSASIHRENGTYAQHEFMLATQAARWGADQELEACRLWVSENCNIYSAVELIQFRRPKPQPPSLKEQALDDLHIAFDTGCFSERQADTIRRALESLPN